MELLDLIENVDPTDTAAMDEIDARVWCWLNKQGRPVYKDKIVHTLGSDNKMEVTRGGWGIDDTDKPVWFLTEYTRSRDALKSIRPEGWWYSCGLNGHARLCYKDESCNGIAFHAQDLPTEELAELYAIISAIQWERENAPAE